MSAEEAPQPEDLQVGQDLGAPVGHARDIRARAATGEMLPEGALAPKAIEGRKLRGERRYMALVAEKLGDEEISRIAETIVRDAQGEGDDPKVINAAREWLAKYAFGAGRVSLEDLDMPPAIVRRK